MTRFPAPYYYQLKIIDCGINYMKIAHYTLQVVCGLARVNQANQETSIQYNSDV